MSVAVVLMTFSVHAQTPTAQIFFQELPQRLATSGAPSTEEWSRVSNELTVMSAEGLAKVLPSIITAAEYPNEAVQVQAAFALFNISVRPDSAPVLSKYVGAIGQLFNAQEHRVQGLASLTLLNLKTSPDEALIPMLASLNRTDREAKEQVTVVGTLARLWPTRPEVIDAIGRFMSRQLDRETLVATLNAIRTSRVDDLRVRRAVTAALEDDQDDVQIASIAALGRMGPAAISEAQDILEGLTRSANRSAEVKSAARSALQLIGR